MLRIFFIVSALTIVSGIPIEENIVSTFSRRRNPIGPINFQNDELIPNTFSWKSKEILQERKFVAEDSEIEYRLPNNSIPLRYDLFLSTDVDKEIFDFNGRVKIHVQILEASWSIYLHARQLAIDEISFLQTNGSLEYESLVFNYNEVNEIIEVSLPEEMTANSEFVLDIKYHGILRRDNAGFYRSAYLNPRGIRKYIATTQFSMTDARHSMPCYDEPGIRAIVGIEIQHNSGYIALSNMPVQSRETVSNTDYVITKFYDTPPIQTYILGFIVCDYSKISSVNNELDIEQRVYAKKASIDKGEGDFTLSIVHPLLQSLQDYFNVSLSMSKIDHVFITDFQFSGMENNGLITYRESNMLYIEGRDGIEMKKRIVEVVAHEIAHHYFGNMVNIKWWSYTWLKEGFARLFQYYSSSLVFPEDDYIERFHKNAQAAAFRFDTIENDAKSLNFYVETPVNIRSKFNTISYDKGSCLLRMMQMAMTIPTFAKALNYYLNDMYYRAATPEDVHRNFQKAYDEDFPNNEVNLEEIMTTWEEQAGYPVVTVERTGGTITLTQTRFGGGDEIYAIPVTYATKSNPDFLTHIPIFWMQDKIATISNIPESDWIILNVGMNSYFKAQYEKDNWEKIIDQLKENYQIIPSVHRRQTFVDMNPQGFEILDVETLLDLMTYLSDEKDAFVWDAVENVEGILIKNLLGTEEIKKFYDFIQGLVKPQLTELGFQDREIDTPKDVRLREILLTVSCATLDDDCLDYEHERLLKFIATGFGTYNSCAGLRKATAEVHSRVTEKMLTSNKELIAGLGCSLNPDILKHYLRIVLTPLNGLNDVERSGILQNTMGQSVFGLNAVFELFNIQDNFSKLRQIIPEQLKVITTSMAFYINTQEQLEVFSTILTKLGDEEFLSEDEIRERINLVNGNFEWLKENLEQIGKWLDDYQNDSQDTTSTTTLSTPFSSTPGSSVPLSHSIVLLLIMFMASYML